MDELIDRYARHLDHVVDAGTYVPVYTANGILAEFARKVLAQQVIDGED